MPAGNVPNRVLRVSSPMHPSWQVDILNVAFGRRDAVREHEAIQSRRTMKSQFRIETDTMGEMKFRPTVSGLCRPSARWRTSRSARIGCRWH